MPNLVQSCNHTSAVVHMQCLDDGNIGIVTAANGIYVLHSGELEPISHITVEGVQSAQKGFAFSPDGRYFAFAQNGSGIIRVIEIATKKLLRSYTAHDNPVELLAFDPASAYIIAGTSTGRVFLWRVESSNLIARLSSFPEYIPSMVSALTHNYVSAIAFLGTWVATTGYGGSIVVTNLLSQANTKRLKPSHVRIDALLFLDEKHIIAGNANGMIELIHTEEQHPIRWVNTGIGGIEHLLLLKNRRFLLAASKFHHIALINIETMQVVENRYITAPSPIRSLAHTEAGNILMGMESGEIREVRLFSPEALRELVDEANFVQAYAMGEADPLAKESAEFALMESIFKERYQHAVSLLSRQQNAEAHHVMHPFAAIPSKSRAVQALFNAFDHYPRFMHLVQDRQYAIAYSLSHQFSQLKQTPSYKQMEKEWETAFAKAQKQAILHHTEAARKTLHEFYTVASKSAFIRLILHQTSLLVEFSRAIQAKDYIRLKKLTAENPVLRETPSYSKMIKNADKTIEEIMSAVKSNLFDKAELLNEALMEIPHLAHHHESITRFIEKAKKLHRYHEEGHTLLCFELLDTSTELSVLPLAKEMEKIWTDSMTTCEEAALHGNTTAITEELGELVKLSSRTEKTGNLLRTSYQMQIKYYLSRNKAQMLQKAITNYTSIFGFDNEIMHLVALSKKRGIEVLLDEEHMQHRPRSLWLTLTNGYLPANIATYVPCRGH